QLKSDNGIRAYRDPQGWPYLTLEARAAGDTGNRIPYQLSLVNAPGSTLRGYPELPSLLSGGQDGTAAKDIVYLSLGATTVRGDYPLDTTKLTDGYHRVRAVAYDGSAAQVQGTLEYPFMVSNIQNPPIAQLPEKVGPAAREVLVPVQVNDKVTRVDLYIDGRMMVSVKDAPFNITLPLAGIGRGEHDLWALVSDADGHQYTTAPTKLVVLVAPEINRITPERTTLTGGTTHRIFGTGFDNNTIVKIGGNPAKSVTVLSPGLLDFVVDSGNVGRGTVEVINPDGTADMIPEAFEFYQPQVKTMQISPTIEVIGMGKNASFNVRCVDQYDQAYKPVLKWTATGGDITADGLFTAPQAAGVVKLSAIEPNGKLSEATVTVGPASLADGVLRHWLILGSFPNTDNKALQAETIPDEKNMQPDHGTKVGELSWQSLYAANGIIDFSSIFTPNTNVVAYGNVYVKAEADTDAIAVFGSDDGIRVWLNGKLVDDEPVKRGLNVEGVKIPVKLVKGWNRLLVKVDQGMGGWAFAMKMTKPDGKPLTGLSYSLDKP
ncbi:MAG: IPT/TIG domain-containing protein, partial [bacterium]